MAKFFADLIDDVQSYLDDDGSLFLDAYVTIKLRAALQQVSEYVPYERKVSFFIESRTGIATTDTSSALVDATESQFLSTDVGKVVQNTTNNTWAIVTAYVSADQLTLSKDIMVDGNENYEIFNKGCSNRFQINIEDVTDDVGPEEHGVIAVEYPIGTRRSWDIDGDILTIDVLRVSDSKVAEPATNTEVLVWFETRQRVLEFADLAGTVNGTPSAGATTFTIAAVGSGTDVITEDALFTVANVRGTYKIKSNLTLSGGGGAIIFYPGLESAPANGAIVSFIGSTLNKEMERLVTVLTASKTALSKTINATTTGGRETVRNYRDELAIVLNELERLKNRRAPRVSETFPRD
ncbi:hypothetical protein LCGC14_0420800 [marine sediment metagenome]|uniref:Uncharacterized protein n=1 Tax=marine sediment metagenome TaxID=412755 RepID=A0A0F9VD60_9ZZZZ